MPDSTAPSPTPAIPTTAFTSRAWLLLAAYLLFVTAVPGLYAFSLRTPPTAFGLLAWLGSGLAFAHLVSRDRVLHGLRGFMPDYSALLLVAWPVVVPYHFFSTRGRAGWRPFAIFVAIYLGTLLFHAALTLAAWAATGQL